MQLTKWGNFIRFKLILLSSLQAKKQSTTGVIRGMMSKHYEVYDHGRGQEQGHKETD